MSDESPNRIDQQDLYYRGAYVSPFHGFGLVVHISCVCLVGVYLFWKVIPLTGADLFSFIGMGIVVAFLLASVILPNIPIVGFLAPVLAEVFLFDRNFTEIHPFAFVLTTIILLHHVLSANFAINQARMRSEEAPIGILPENPIGKKMLEVAEGEDATPGFKSLTLVANTLGVVFITIVMSVTAIEVGRFKELPFIIAALTSILAIAYTVTNGLSLIYVQRTANVWQALKWVGRHLVLTIFGFATLYLGFIDAPDLTCLSIPKADDFIDQMMDAMYFSMVTFTTLGYGDIQPVGFCRMMAMSEALCGIFFTPVFVVFLVGVVSNKTSTSS